MTQPRGDCRDVDTSFEQVHGRGVADDMGRDVVGVAGSESGTGCEHSQDVSDTRSAETATMSVEEEGTVSGVALCEPALKGDDRSGP